MKGIKKPRNEMRLQDKFIRVFIVPLFCGILISIILTVVVLLVYANRLANDSSLSELLQDVDNQKSMPILLSARNILYKKIQPVIYSLMNLKSYYNFLVDNLKSKDLQINTDDFTLLTKYMMNAEQIDKDFVNNTKNSDYEKYLDSAMWYIDPNITTFDKLNNKSKCQLQLISRMIPAIRSIYEVSKDNYYNQYMNISIAFYNTMLISSYPMQSNINNINIKDFYKNYNNPLDCRNEENTFPLYYYFPCSKWWIFSEKRYKESNNSAEITITPPYKKMDNEHAMTVCLRFNDIYTLNILNDNSSKNYGRMCIDIITSDLIKIFDHFNKDLNGYYFIMQTNSEIPIYYPNYAKYPYSSNLVRYEFDLNLTFYIKELMDFPFTIVNFTEQINDTQAITRDDIYRGVFMKNGSNYTYQKVIVPMFINSDRPSEPTHLMTIIFVTFSGTFADTFSKIQAPLYPRLTIQIILFCIMGAILLLIAWYLIVSIAINIVKPIKNLKNLIQGMNNKKLVANIEKKHKEKNKQNTEKEIDDNDEEDEDDEFLETRSAEIDNLFNILLKLKRVLSFTTNPVLNNDKSALINYVNAKYTFSEVQNIKGRNLCDSNVGNLALKCQKYDKAIFHLLESLKEAKSSVNEKEKNIIIKNSILSNLPGKKTIRKSNSTMSKSKVFTNSDLKKILDKEENQSLIKNSQKSVVLEKRYPKLLYSYKKFFITLNKLMKDEDFFDEVAKHDIYVLKEKHSLENYEQILRNYLEDSKKADDTKRVAEALLEYNEFLIKYHIKPTDSSSEMTEAVKIMKTKSLNNIVENFEMFETIYEKMKDLKSNEYIKNFVELMQNSKRETIDMIEIPILILNQKSNYLKGKLAFYCEEYPKALDYLFKSREIDLISDATILKKSIKLIKKIMNIVKGNIEKEQSIQVIKTNNIEEKKVVNIKGYISKLKENKEKIEQYIEELDKEIEKYTYYHRDIMILIDISKSMMNDDKKVEKATKNTMNIFENYITSDDRFGVFFYGNSVNSIINLSYKNINSYSYIRELLENMKKLMEEYRDNENSNVIKSIMKMYEYMKKKSKFVHLKLGFRNREKWIIIFTDNFNTDQREESLYELSNFFKRNDPLFNVVLIGINLSIIDKDKIKTFLNFNKSTMIDFDDISKLRMILRIMGNIRNDIVFPNENYDADRKYN